MKIKIDYETIDGELYAVIRKVISTENAIHTTIINVKLDDLLFDKEIIQRIINKYKP